MANPSFSIDDEVYDDFKDVIREKEREAGPGTNISRSAIVQQLIEDYVAENEEYLNKGNPNRREATAD